MAKHLTDLTGQTFGFLAVLGYAGTQRDPGSGAVRRRWNCRCSFCEGTCVETTERLTGGRAWHCPACQPSRKGADYLKNYTFYREQFTPQQQRRYEQIMRGRKGRTAEAEAVDLVMREAKSAA